MLSTLANLYTPTTVGVIFQAYIGYVYLTGWV